MAVTVRAGRRCPHCGGYRPPILADEDGRVRCAGCGREPYLDRDAQALVGSGLNPEQVARLRFVRWEHRVGRR